MLLPIHADHPDPRRRFSAPLDALSAGEVIGYPTDTVYGLGCDLTNKRAVDRLYALKRMPRTQPLAFICPDLADIARYAIVEKPAYRILKHYLPGPYCFILEATREVPKLLLSKRKTIGIRIPHLRGDARARGNGLGRPAPVDLDGAARRRRSVRGPGRASTTPSPGSVLRRRRRRQSGLVPTTIIDLTKTPPEVPPRRGRACHRLPLIAWPHDDAPAHHLRGWKAFGLADFSPFGLKVQTYLRMLGVPYEAKIGDPRKAPTKKIPYIVDGTTVLGDSGLIFDYLKKKRAGDACSTRS